MMKTQLLRNKEPLPLRWGWWHLACLSAAMEYEQQAPLSLYPENGEYVFTKRHHYVDAEDGEVLDLYPGDTYVAWRA